MSENSAGKRLLPALRAQMGDWIYYVVLMSFEDVAGKIRLAQEIHKHKALKELLQRTLTNRAKTIGAYLCNQKQHFFNAIIAGVYEGEPSWVPITVSGNARISTKELPDLVTSSVGVLELSGDEKIFAIDGQHRVEGIRTAIATKPRLGTEEQAVIFVAHRNTRAGLQRTRRLFSTLNRYAKPVTLGEVIAIDEDDIIAITTRAMLEENHFFSKDHIIYVSKAKTVPRRNTTCLTSIHCLYESLDIVLFSRAQMKQRKSLKTLRPSDVVVQQFYEQAAEFWDTMIRHFRPLKELLNSPAQANVAGRYRGDHGGHLLFRPAGLLSIAKAVRMLMDDGMTRAHAIRAISQLEMELANPPWAGLLWETGSRKMIIDKKNQAIATKLLLYMCGATVAHFGFTEEDLHADYAAALNRDLDQVTLPVPLA